MEEMNRIENENQDMNYPATSEQTTESSGGLNGLVCAGIGALATAAVFGAVKLGKKVYRTIKVMKELDKKEKEAMNELEKKLAEDEIEEVEATKTVSEK